MAEGDDARADATDGIDSIDKVEFVAATAATVETVALPLELTETLGVVINNRTLTACVAAEVIELLLEPVVLSRSLTFDKTIFETLP